MPAVEARASLFERARRANPLPDGSFSVGVGLLANGVGAYVFLALAARSLGTSAFSSLSVLWAVAFFAAPGLFLPLEQEVSRTVASRRAGGIGASAVIRQSALLGVALLVVVLAASLVSLRWVYDLLFDEDALLFAGFALALCGYCLAHLARGVLAGQGRFRAYATYFGAEGVLRVATGVAFGVLGVASVGPFGISIGVVPLLAVGVALVGQRGLLEPGPPARTGELTASLGALLAGSLFTALLLNAGPLAIEWYATADESDEAGRFLAGLVIARVPLFLYQAVQASLLPKLSLYAGGQHWVEFRSALRRLILAVCGLGVAATVVAATIGPLVVRVVFGDEFSLGNRDLGLLALSSAVFMLAVTFGQSLIALAAPARMAGGWVLGVAVFGVVTALGSDLYLRVELGLVAGTLAVAAVLALALGIRYRELRA